jgi:hypothetical protein
MTRILLTVGLLILSMLLLAGCAGSARADHDPGTAASVALHWQDPTTLVVAADGFASDEVVLLDVLITHDAVHREEHAGSLRQLTQQSRQQLTTTVAADAAGVVAHTLTLVAPVDTPVHVTLTDQAGHSRTATTALPVP